MKAPCHHVPLEYLRDYALGLTPEPVSLWVSVHLTWCPICRDRVDRVETHAGERLAASAPNALSETLLASTLERLEDSPQEATLPDAARQHPRWGQWPAPLLAYLPNAEPDWEFIVPGVRRIELPLTHGDGSVQLFRLKAGSKVAHHEHRGTELTAILSGGFSDAEGHYERGDVLVRPAVSKHAQSIPATEDCVCLVVNSSTIEVRGVLGALFRIWARFRRTLGMSPDGIL